MFIFFNSDYTLEIKEADVKDGKAVIGDKEYYVDKAKPLMLKTTFGSKPVYFVKWDSITPLNWTVKEKREKFSNEKGEEIEVKRREIEFIDPKFDDSKKILPEILKITGETRFLKGLKSYAEGRKPFEMNTRMIMLFVGTFLIVGAIAYFMFQMGWLKF